MADLIAHVLFALEALEAQQINLGLYSTHISPEDILKDLEDSAEEPLREAISLGKVRSALLELVEQREVIQWKPNFFRSRIAEFVRILRMVRQRFWSQRTRKDLFNSAPLLVEDIRVEFRRRVRPKRTIHVSDLMKEVSTIPDEIVDAFLNSLKFETVSEFQARALKDIFSCARQGNPNDLSFIIAGDTGAGKTEAFFFPILLDIASEPDDLRLRQGVRAVLVYPRIRLARNQLKRLLQYTVHLHDAGGARVTFGIQNGDVPDSAQKLQDKKWPKKEIDGRVFYRVELLEGCLRCKKGHYWIDSQDPAIDTGFPLMRCDHCPHMIDTLCISHEALKRNAPDVFIITDVSLSQWLTRQEYSHLWGLWEKDVLRGGADPTVPPRFLVLDEVHLYEQLKGAHVARLIKRFQARTQLVHTQTSGQKCNPIVIGVSATLHDERAFLAKLMDVDPVQEQKRYACLQCIKPRDSEVEYTGGRERYIFIYPRNFSPTPARPEYWVNDQAAAIQTVMAAVHNLMTPEKEWRALAFFDSINDLRQFRHDYDDPTYRDHDQGGSNWSTNSVQQPPANQEELWRIRTDREKKGGKRVINECKGCEKHMQNASLYTCPHFTDGDCWVFAKIHGCNRRLRVADSVYAGSRDDTLLEGKDLIPTSPSLEVGYDDDAIQLVYQHKAPPNAANFIQRRGRAGRRAEDFPVIITLLWPYRRNDAFYFFHPEALYEPTFDDVPLNANNFTVQRTHTLLAFFDLLACWRRQNIGGILDEPGIIDFTVAGKHRFFLGPTVVRDTRGPFMKNNQELFIVTTQTRKEVVFKGKHISDKWVEKQGNGIAVAGWLAMQKGLILQILKPAWEKLNADGSFDAYIESSGIASKSFRSHRSYPFFRGGLTHQSSKLPTNLLNRFGQQDWHLNNDRERDNWLKTYRHIDWMLQGNQEATTLTVQYPDPGKERSSSDDAQPEELLTTNVSFALTELLPGNVSYRLRESEAIHWTPIPKDGESTFLYPLKAENDQNGEIRVVNDDVYTPKLGDIASQPNSIFGISQYLYERFRSLQFMTPKGLRVKAFGQPGLSHSPNWYFVPDDDNPNKSYAIDIDEPGALVPKNAFRISRGSSARANSVIIPFTADSRYSFSLVLSSPLDVLFNSIEGYLREGTSLPGYYRIFYEMNIDIKGEKGGQQVHLLRNFYPLEPERDGNSEPKPILVGYMIKTHTICFQVNSDLLEETVDDILGDEQLRLYLRRNYAVYLTAPKSAEWELFIQTQLDWAEVAVDYWLQEVVAPNDGEPRKLDSSLDRVPLTEFFKKQRIVREEVVKKFEQFLMTHSSFFESLNEVLDIAFRKNRKFRDFVISVILHSLSTLLKNLIARLGGVGSDGLVAYADLPMFKHIDGTINPRIIIMDTVEGGSGGITQAYERLDLSNNNEGSLCWMLLTELGKCPIGDGEALVRSVLTEASTDQLLNVQASRNQMANGHSSTEQEDMEHLLRKLHITSPGEEATRILGRVLFKEVGVSGDQHINPALILKELFMLQNTLESQIPGKLDRRATILHAVANSDPERQPAIVQLRDVLTQRSVARDELDHELAQQLFGLYNSACEDGCPICSSADSDIEHIYLAPKLNSRRVLKKLRGVLIKRLPRGESVSAVDDHILAGSPALIDADPGRLGNQLNASIGIGVIPEINDSGGLQNTSTIVVNSEHVKDFIVNGDWGKRWPDKPFKTPRWEIGIRSKAEYVIANMLEEEDIVFEPEPKLSYRDEQGHPSFIHPSFFLFEHKLYIEYWGRNEAEYMESRSLKERVYEQLQRQDGIRILYLEAKDIEENIFMDKIKARIEDDHIG
jgi:hypothetical protein